MRRNRRRARRIRPKWKPSGQAFFLRFLAWNASRTIAYWFSCVSWPRPSLRPQGLNLGACQVVIPPSASKDDIATGLYNGRPFFSLASAVMTDDQTQQKYAVLPPVAPPGKAYFPGVDSPTVCFPDKERRSRSNSLHRLRHRQSKEESLRSRRFPFCFPGPIANVPVPAPSSDQ